MVDHTVELNEESGSSDKNAYKLSRTQEITLQNDNRIVKVKVYADESAALIFESGFGDFNASNAFVIIEFPNKWQLNSLCENISKALKGE